MNRRLVFGIAVFMAVAGISIVDGGNTASAGIGCRGCGGLFSGHGRVRHGCGGHKHCGGLLSRLGAKHCRGDCDGVDHRRGCGGRKCGGLLQRIKSRLKCRGCAGPADCCGVPKPACCQHDKCCHHGSHGCSPDGHHHDHPEAPADPGTHDVPEAEAESGETTQVDRASNRIAYRMVTFRR